MNDLRGFPLKDFDACYYIGQYNHIVFFYQQYFYRIYRWKNKYELSKKISICSSSLIKLHHLTLDEKQLRKLFISLMKKQLVINKNKTEIVKSSKAKIGNLYVGTNGKIFRYHGKGKLYFFKKPYGKIDFYNKDWLTNADIIQSGYLYHNFELSFHNDNYAFDFYKQRVTQNKDFDNYLRYIHSNQNLTMDTVFGNPLMDIKVLKHPKQYIAKYDNEIIPPKKFFVYQFPNCTLAFDID